MIPMTIAGAGDRVAANPEMIDFGQQPVEVAGAPQDVTIVNCSPSPLEIGSFLIDGDTDGAFAAQGPASMTLPVGGSQTWSVVFTAKHEGSVMASLDFTTDQAPISIPLHGTGGGAVGPDGGPGDNPNTYYGCGCHSSAPGGAAAPIVIVVIGLALRRRRGARLATPNAR